jgi:hypothetical protein
LDLTKAPAINDSGHVAFTATYIPILAIDVAGISENAKFSPWWGPGDGGEWHRARHQLISATNMPRNDPVDDTEKPVP